MLMDTAESNKYMPRRKNHLHSRARIHKSLCALGQDLAARKSLVVLFRENVKLVVSDMG